MITEEIEIAKKIFAIVEQGIIDGYDSFEYRVEAHDGYMEEELLVTMDSETTSNVRRDYSSAMLHQLVVDLKERMYERGDRWKSFVMSCREGENVNFNFEY